MTNLNLRSPLGGVTAIPGPRGQLQQRFLSASFIVFVTMCYKGVQHSSSFPPFSILTASITTNPFVVVIALVAASRLLRRSFLFPFLGSQSSSACRPMMTPRLLQLRRVRKQRAPLRYVQLFQVVQNSHFMTHFSCCTISYCHLCPPKVWFAWTLTGFYRTSSAEGWRSWRICPR